MWLNIAFLIDQNRLTKEELLLGKRNDMIFSIDLLLQKYTEKEKLLPYNTRTYPTKDFFEKQCFSTEEARTLATKQFLQQHPEYQDLLFPIQIPKFKSGSKFLVEHEGQKIPLAEAMAGDERLAKLEELAARTEKYLLLYPVQEFMESQKDFPDFYNFLKKTSYIKNSIDI